MPPFWQVFDERYAHIAKDIVRDTLQAAVCPTASASAVSQSVAGVEGATADVGGFHLVFEDHVPDRFLQPEVR